MGSGAKDAAAFQLPPASAVHSDFDHLPVRSSRLAFGHLDARPRFFLASQGTESRDEFVCFAKRADLA
jgi:hypothetical protein